ncbi:hypothetical protein GCM10020001_009390 [Nonomuraea salmonea]
MINGPSRRALFAGTFAGLALPAATSAGAPASAESSISRGTLPERPNILLILADDLGWGEIGSNGQRSIRTPNLDRLAAEGVKFATAYAGAPLCAPSRCALLTGLHAGHGTVRENPEGGPQHALTDADLTFAELLRLAGYRTACIGKWGVRPRGARPRLAPERPRLRRVLRLHRPQARPPVLPQVPVAQRREGAAQRQVVRAAPVPRARRRVHQRRQRQAVPAVLRHQPPARPPSAVPGDAGPYESRPWSGPNRRHAAQVARLDTDVAALIRALRDAGVAERTLVLFTSDNGPHHEKGVTPELFNSNGPFRGDKRDVYEGGIRVPMIAWSPGLRHRVVRQPVAFWDVLPTLADLAEVPVPARIDGLSFRGLLTGGSAPKHDHLVWNRPRKAQAIRRGRWKAVRFNPHIAGGGPARQDRAVRPRHRPVRAPRPGRGPPRAGRATAGQARPVDRPRPAPAVRAAHGGDRGPGRGDPAQRLRRALEGRAAQPRRRAGRAGAQGGLGGPPGMAISVGFPVPSGRIAARADFRAAGRKQVFRHAHRALTPG